MGNFVSSLAGKKDLVALQQQIGDLKAQLVVSGRWSGRWKVRCYRYRKANAAAILRSIDGLDFILDRVTEIDDTIAACRAKYGERSFASVLQGLDRIRESAEQCLKEHAQDFNIDPEESEIQPEEEENARHLRLVYSKSREASTD